MSSRYARGGAVPSSPEGLGIPPSIGRPVVGTIISPAALPPTPAGFERTIRTHSAGDESPQRLGCILADGWNPTQIRRVQATTLPHVWVTILLRRWFDMPWLARIVLREQFRTANPVAV